jgi:hypothetical protein
MENEKLLWDIESELEIFQAHVKRMRKNSDKLHVLDVEILQDKTRKLYDKLICLSEASSGKAENKTAYENLEEKPTKPEVTFEDTFYEKKEETKQVEENIISAEVKNDSVTEIEPEVTKVEIELPRPGRTEPPKIEAEEQPDLIREETSDKEQPTPITENYQDKSQTASEKPRVVRSAIDLFSDTVEETIADKLGHSNDSSIARKMQQSQIADLRQAIGINEKFLFINGLFNGDLGRYNKAIDEFNELTTKEGVNAHFLELKIHNQWSDDNDGAVKLKALLDRKFS